jgi:hypothetical protein
MARRDEGCASIGCLGICFLAVVGMCTGGGSGGNEDRGDVPIAPPATSAPTTTLPSPPPPVVVEDLRPPGKPRELHIGPKGGCYYVTDSGDRNYVARSECERADVAPAAPEPLVSPGPGASDAEPPPGDSALPYVAPQPLVATGNGNGFLGADPLPVGGARQLHVGSRGGCYYISDSGRKEYVDHPECRRAGTAAEPEPLSSTRSGSSAGGSRRRSGGGRQLHVGPRGGCYYINGSGNKTYVDRSECH